MILLYIVVTSSILIGYKYASNSCLLCFSYVIPTDNKQLLDEVLVISGIIKVEVSVISRSRRLRLIILTDTFLIPDITKTESNNCFIIHCFEENNDKRIIEAITVYFQTYCSWKSCIARATYRLFTNLYGV